MNGGYKEFTEQWKERRLECQYKIGELPEMGKPSKEISLLP
jgi:hypothetical protein